jgi:hypothetical protein
MFAVSASNGLRFMGQAIETFVALVFVGAGLIAIAWTLTVRLTPESNRGRIARWLLSWSVKGVIVPLVLWSIINIGITWNLQAFMPQVQAARNHGGNWVPAYLRVVAAGFYIVSSNWTAVTLGWLLFGAYGAAEETARADFKRLCLTCWLGLGIPAGLILWMQGWPAIGLATTLLVAPVAAYSRELLHPRKLPPMYARAVARMKFGKYTEAEWEIIKELENWEDDFDGWMMLADLYANHFNNLKEGEQTILELCAQPKTTASQVAVALHRLADWHLKIAKDPDSARGTLLMICERFKGTHLAHMAQLRINQLPATALELREQKSAQTIPLPALGDQLDAPAEVVERDTEKAAKAANAYVEQLTQNPNNVAAREKLARLLTERLNKAQLGIEQIEQLLEMPERSDTERAGWLGLIAAWHIKYRQDFENGRKNLERLTREFPGSAQAFAARRRLELLDRQSSGKVH